MIKTFPEIKPQITFLSLLKKYNGKISLATDIELQSVKRNGLNNLFLAFSEFNKLKHTGRVS